MRVLHVLPQIDGGGPARSLLALGRQTAAADLALEHRVVALSRQANGPMIAVLARHGLVPSLAPTRDAIDALVAAADVVLVHYWHSPAMAAFLAAPLPACRLAFWLKVDGRHLPQRLLPEHIAYADAVVPTAPSPLLPGVPWVPGLADFSRLEALPPTATRDAVTYMGTVNRGKMHPDFFALSDRIAAPGLRFPVVGGPLDPWFAARRAATREPSRYVLPGYVEDVASILSAAAVFGYPLAADTYATTDKVLQEAMWAGVPPVVIAGRGPAHCVTDGETGRVAAADDEYPALVSDLLERPALRRHMGLAAADYARRAFDPGAHARRLMEMLAALTRAPKRHRAPLFADPNDGSDPVFAAAYRLARGFGDAGAPLVRSLVDPTPDGMAEAVRALAALPPIATFADGGVFHFRNHHPNDFALRLWTGILFTIAGHRDRATAEFAAAESLGVRPEIRRACEATAFGIAAPGADGVT